MFDFLKSEAQKAYEAQLHAANADETTYIDVSRIEADAEAYRQRMAAEQQAEAKAFAGTPDEFLEKTGRKAAAEAGIVDTPSDFRPYASTPDEYRQKCEADSIANVASPVAEPTPAPAPAKAPKKGKQLSAQEAIARRRNAVAGAPAPGPSTASGGQNQKKDKPLSAAEAIKQKRNEVAGVSSNPQADQPKPDAATQSDVAAQPEITPQPDPNPASNEDLPPRTFRGVAVSSLDLFRPGEQCVKKRFLHEFLDETRGSMSMFTAVYVNIDKRNGHETVTPLGVALATGRFSTSAIEEGKAYVTVMVVDPKDDVSYDAYYPLKSEDDEDDEDDPITIAGIFKTALSLYFADHRYEPTYPDLISKEQSPDEPPEFTVTIRYLDESGKEMAPPTKIFEVRSGDPVTVTPQEIDGYVAYPSVVHARITGNTEFSVTYVPKTDRVSNQPTAPAAPQPKPKAKAQTTAVPAPQSKPKAAPPAAPKPAPQPRQAAQPKPEATPPASRQVQQPASPALTRAQVQSMLNRRRR